MVRADAISSWILTPFIARKGMRLGMRSSGPLAWVVSAGPCFGQFVLTQKNATGLYPAGEKAVWTGRPTADFKLTNATYTVHKNGTPRAVQPGSLDFSTGSAVIEAGLDAPGELELELTPPPQWETNSPAHPTHSPQPATSIPAISLRRDQWLSALVKGNPRL